jgi:hypothetical protein
MASQKIRDDSPEGNDVDLSRLSAELYETRRPKVLRGEKARDLVVLTAPDYDELTESLEVAAGLLRGDADIAAGRVHSNEEVQEWLRTKIREAARLTA